MRGIAKPVGFDTFPEQGTIVFALPIAYLGQVMDAIVEDIASPSISYVVTPFNSQDPNTFEVDAFKLAIQTVAYSNAAALYEYGQAVERVISDLIHACVDDE